MSDCIRQPRSRLCDPGGDLVILFARAPVPGRVKSRLQPPLTPLEACRLHVAATCDTADMLDQALPEATKRIFWSGAPQGGSCGMELPPSFLGESQRGDDLGERMADAFHRAFAFGARRVVIVGSDSPHLPASRVTQSFAALDHRDCVLGPAEDGGYYLIGCRRFHPRLFDGVAWSSSKVFEQTMTNAARLEYTVAVLESWYDLDNWEDVERLAAEGIGGMFLPLRVAEFLSRLEKEQGGRNLFRASPPSS